MKTSLITIVLSVILFQAKCQEIDGIWISTYKYDLQKNASNERIEFERNSGLFDFYNDSEFLIFDSFTGNRIGKYKKHSDTIYELKIDNKKFILEIINSLTFKVQPKKTKNLDKPTAYIFEKVKEQTITNDWDSIKSIIKNNLWSISTSNVDFTFEFTDSLKNDLILYQRHDVDKSVYNLINYKGFYFFTFFDPFLSENLILQLNKFEGNQFESFLNNLGEYDTSAKSEKVILIHEKTPELNECEGFFNHLVGKWNSDMTDWKSEFIISDSVIFSDNLTKRLQIDSILYNYYQLEINEDSTYSFVNEGVFFDDAKQISISDTVEGKWRLDKTLKYIELTPSETIIFETDIVPLRLMDNGNIYFDVLVYYEDPLPSFKINSVYKKEKNKRP